MGALLSKTTSGICAHGGQAQIVPTQTRVMVDGQPAATMADADMVAGCPYAPGGVPTPCVQVQWSAPAARVLIAGSPALLQTSQSICLPNGTPLQILTTQTRVMGS